MTKLPVFDKYFTKEDAEYYTELFQKNGLHPFIDPPKETFNAIFGNTQVDLQYILRLPVEEFNQANKLIEQEIKKAGLPSDYYLHELSNEELYDVVKNSQAWNRQDVVAAFIIMKKRNYRFDETQLEKDKQVIKQAHKAKRNISLPVLILFYIIAPLGAFLPVFVGLMIYLLKDTDLDGQRDYVFSDRYRKHGLILSFIGILSMLAWLYVIV